MISHERIYSEKKEKNLQTVFYKRETSISEFKRLQL